MDSAAQNPTLTERRSTGSVNGSIGRSPNNNGGGARSGGPPLHLNISSPMTSSGMSLLDTPNPTTLPMLSSPLGPPPGVIGSSIGVSGGGGVHFHIARVVVNKVEGGYGMKVSGDNPVFVQSVKPGGAAEKAGLHAGDKIMEVNGVDVVSSTHTEVVALIRASSQVILTVQKRTGSSRASTMGSPSQDNRPHSGHNTSSRITYPQPVDYEKQSEFDRQKAQHYRLMIEKDQRYMETLRSELARSPDDTKCVELEKAAVRIENMQMLLDNMRPPSHGESCGGSDSPPPPLPSTPPPKLQPKKSSSKRHHHHNNGSSSSKSRLSSGVMPTNNNCCNTTIEGTDGHRYYSHLPPDEQEPPPLPRRNPRPATGEEYDNNDNNNREPATDNALYLPPHDQATPDAHAPPIPPRYASMQQSSSSSSSSSKTATTNPRYPDPDAVNSINKQMSYPLVATCATIINNCPPSGHIHHIGHAHQRTKSSPDSLTTVMSTSLTAATPAVASLLLIGSESMTDLSGRDRRRGATTHGAATTPEFLAPGGVYEHQRPGTPPGTPPPPYPSPLPGRRCYGGSNRSSGNIDDGDGYEAGPTDLSSPDVSPLRGSVPIGSCGRPFTNSSPIHAANSHLAQQSIMSMEDEDISDQEAIQMEDHGSFKSINKLLESTPHLAVFMNYVLSNSNPNSLLFFLLTDMYKEGNTKEMRKWAYEIHSCFLVPGAPLRLSNVDEQVALEVDDVLQREYDKEEILRRIFYKARVRAKEELHRQLADFQQKRTAGLSTMYGPLDAVLSELRHDRNKEIKTYEAMLLNKLEPYLKELDDESYDPKKCTMAAALTTVITRTFGVRPPAHDLDRCPTFVNKEKSFRTKFGIARFQRKLNVLGHQFVAQQYFTVIRCSNCQQIIYGISPQGYECSTCHINLHRHCVRQFDEVCPGPINNKKDRGMLKIIDRIKPEKEQKRRTSANFLQAERDSCVAQSDGGDANKPGNPVTRSGSDRRPDALREETSGSGGAGTGGGEVGASSHWTTHHHLRDASHDSTHDHDGDNAHQESSVSLPASSGTKGKTSSSINRSESVKEHQTAEKQRKKPRNRSDPLQTRNDTVDQRELVYHNPTSSSSSSSHSLSPSSSIDAGGGGTGDGSGSGGLHDVDSDMEIDTELPEWSAIISADELSRLSSAEKDRQEIINELFHTERYHLGKLKILERIFHRPLQHRHVFSDAELSLIFANLPELLAVHSQFNAAMQAKRRAEPIVGDVGDIVLNMFNGPYREIAATFYERQEMAIEFVRERRRKDQRCEMELGKCEKSNYCRRQNLQSFLTAEMQRLSKYPLIIERLIKKTEKTLGEVRKSGNLPDVETKTKELERLKEAYDKCKDTVKYLNETVRVACNRARLQKIQDHLDIKIENAVESSGPRSDQIQQFVLEYKNLDLTRYTLIREDRVDLIRTNKNPLSLQMLLCEEAVVFLLHENDRFVLKYLHSGQTSLAPIIRITSLFVRENASTPNNIFLLNFTQNTQMYELRTKGRTDRELWFKQLSDAADAYNKREGAKGGTKLRTDPGTPSTTTHLSATAAAAATAVVAGSGGASSLSTRGIADHRNDDESSTPPAQQQTQERNGNAMTDSVLSDGGSTTVAATTSGENGAAEDDAVSKRLSGADLSDEGPSTNQHPPVGSSSVTVKLEADQWALVQPSEVHVAVPPVHTAQPVLTPLEQLRRKDDEVLQALDDKKVLVAGLLSIPLQDYNNIAEMASEESMKMTEKEPIELILASVYQIDQVWRLVNASTNVDEADSVLATGGKHASCASNAATVAQHASALVPSVPTVQLEPIVKLLSSQLTTLLSVIKQGEEERLVLRKELQRTREQLHRQTVGMPTTPTIGEDPQHASQTQDFNQSGDLARIEESPTETDTT